LQDSFVIFTISPDGSRLKRLTDVGSDDSHATWSPDGEWIAFSSARMGFKDEALNTDSPQPYGEIFIMRYDGTRVQQLTDNQWEEGTPAWLPSSHSSSIAQIVVRRGHEPTERRAIGASLTRAASRSRRALA
jgi:Tol biopolymer transport system component